MAAVLHPAPVAPAYSQFFPHNQGRRLGTRSSIGKVLLLGGLAKRTGPSQLSRTELGIAVASLLSYFIRDL